MKSLLIGLVLCAAAWAQQTTAPATDQFVGTYTGTWQSPYGSGATVLSITTDNGTLKGRVVLTGSPVGYKGDDLSITVAKFVDDIMTINFKAKHGRLTGTGIFQNGTFVGDFRFRYFMAVDKGSWNLQK